MEFLAHPVVATVIFLGILIFVHEAGHFLVGKFSGVAVEIFSIGFGPVLLSFKKGETVYRLSAIPLGGFVKFFGMVRSEPVPEHVKGREFYNASISARLATVAAGPIANFLLAMVAFTMIGFHGVELPKAVVGEIMPNSPAEKAGLKYGDVFLQLNSSEIKHWQDLREVISENPNIPMMAKVQRLDGTIAKLTLEPESNYNADLGKQQGRVGISPNFVSPVITVIKQTGADLGFVTGQRVVSVEVDGIVHGINHYRDIALALDKAKPGSKRELVFKVNQPGLAESSGPDDKSTITKSILVASPDSANSGQAIVTWLGLTDSQTTIKSLRKDDSGFDIGDKIITWNGTPVNSIFDLNEVVVNNENPTAKIEVVRGFETVLIEPKLEAHDMQKLEGKVTIYSVPGDFLATLEQGETVLEKYSNPLKAMAYGAEQTWKQTMMIGGAVVGLFTGSMPLKALGGPIAIAKVASDSVKLGWLPFLTLLALISINLGLFNLIPIPVLDGGQMLMIGAEGLMRKPLPEAAIEGYQKVGFVMILALIAMATYNDVGRFWASMVSGLGSSF